MEKQDILSRLSKGESITSIAKIWAKDDKNPNYDKYRKKIRRLKRTEEGDGIESAADKDNIDLKDVTSAWIRTENASWNVKKQQKSYLDFRDELIEQMQEYSPKYEPIKREQILDPCLFVLDPADLHIGKRYWLPDRHTGTITRDIGTPQTQAEYYGKNIERLIRKSSGHNIDKILLVIGNDVLHVDGKNNQTTAGTPQDTNGTFTEMFYAAKDLYVQVIESLMQIADVHVVYNPSNHDFHSGFFLADTIKTWFRNSPNVTFDVSLEVHKYFVYGKNLITTTHGDNSTGEKIPLIVANEVPELWAAAINRVALIHHYHHKIKLAQKDYIGMTVEYMRSPSGTDYYHHIHGFTARRAIEAKIYYHDGMETDSICVNVK